MNSIYVFIIFKIIVFKFYKQIWLCINLNNLNKCHKMFRIIAQSRAKACVLIIEDAKMNNQGHKRNKYCEIDPFWIWVYKLCKLILYNIIIYELILSYSLYIYHIRCIQFFHKPFMCDTEKLEITHWVIILNNYSNIIIKTMKRNSDQRFVLNDNFYRNSWFIIFWI